MGNSANNNKSSDHPLEKFRVEEWALVPHLQNLREGNYKVMAHKTQKLELQKYEVIFNSQGECLMYRENFFHRQKYDKFLVSAFHMNAQTQRGMCAAIYLAEVYAERIPFRLSQLQNLSVNQSLLILEYALRGYQMIFKQTGFFELSADMIGINSSGKPKVWMSPDFSKNFPDLSTINHNLNESDFITKLIELIEERTEYLPNLIKFSHYAKGSEDLSFESCLHFLEKYCQEFTISLSKRIKKGDLKHKLPRRSHE